MHMRTNPQHYQGFQFPTNPYLVVLMSHSGTGCSMHDKHSIGPV